LGDYEARVRMVEPLGAFTMVEVDFDGQPVRALAEPGARYDGAAKIGFDEERMHFFEPKTGQRL
jgi:hypothetical protein